MKAILRTLNTFGSTSKFDHDWARWAKLDEFARGIGFRFSRRSDARSYPGMYFGGMIRGYVTESLTYSDHTHRTVDIGTVTVQSLNSEISDVVRGYVAVQLDRKLPNMVLDATSNNGLFGLSNLPMTIARGQKLSLEGDFDKHFTLYCPKTFEADALYIFTPDLMASLIDQGAAYDVEIVDDWLFFYNQRPHDFSDSVEMRNIFTLVDIVGGKTRGRTARYRDDRPESPTPAGSIFGLTAFDDARAKQPGGRLKKSTMLFWVVLAVIGASFIFAGGRFFFQIILALLSGPPQD